MKIAHILVATDLSQEATRCIPPVAELARSTGARITLLHVIGSRDAIPHGAPFAPPIREPGNLEEAERARTELDERVALFGAGIPIETQLISGGDPATVITEWADENNVDLIAVATHGRTGFRRLALGSVAEAVIRHSRVPVLVLPRPKT